MLDNKVYSSAKRCRLGDHHEPQTAIYCRTAVKDDFAIENQIYRLLDFAIDNGHTKLSFYIDNGEGGTSLNRPEMNRLVEDINVGLVQTVIVTDASRIARGMEPMYDWLQILKRADVTCLSLNSGVHDIRIGVNSLYDIGELLLLSK